MAHGWDSYFHNLPPLSSDSSTLRKTSESDGSLSQHIENFIGHDFPSAVVSQEAPATNPNLNTNYYSNPSMENPSSDCLYQRYSMETPWQADGEQMENLPRCGNSDISDFATDGLSTSGSFPSDLQELKQDCGMLATSFLEDYSDVSSCSDADVGGARPSCKFMTSNSVPKPKTDVATKPSSSEWLFTDTGNTMAPTESVCPNILKTNAVLPSTSNVIVENSAECAQNKMKSPEKNVKSHTGCNHSSTTSNKASTTGSKTVEDRNDADGCPDQIQKETAEREGIDSNISMSGHENLTGDGIGCLDGNDEEQTVATAPNSMSPSLDNEEDHSGENVLRKEIKESDGQDRNMTEDEQDKSKVLKQERRESSSLEKKTSDEQTSPNPNSSDSQDETNIQEKEDQSNTSQSLDPPNIKVSDSRDATDELGECTSTSESNSHDVESCFQSSEHQSSKSVAQDNICQSSAVMGDGHFSNASDKNEQRFANHSESCLQSSSSITDVSPSLEKDCTSVAEKTNAISSPDPDCNDPGVSRDSPLIHTSNKNKQGVASHVESCLQPSSPSRDANSCLKNEGTSLPVKKMTTSSTEPDCSDLALTGDNKEQSVSNGLEPSSQSSTLSTGINPCLEKERTSPAENANETSSPDQQQSLYQKPVALDPRSLDRDLAKNARSEELDISAKKPSLLGVLYGEPLSREDSSCDADETKIETSVASPDSKSMSYSGQAPQLKSSTQMRKRLQPVVVLQTTESVNGTTKSYHCIDCQHTTHNIDHLIEHHHCCHSVHNFQFCKTCNLYLMKIEQAEPHVCCVTKDSLQRSSDSSPRKKRKMHYGGRRCMRCGLIFSKRVQYIAHVRSHTGKTPYKCNGCGLYFAQASSLRRHKHVPGRCKETKHPVTIPDVVVKETEAAPEKDLVWNKTFPNLPQCYVKLVDISTSYPCNICGKGFSTAAKAKKHIYNTHKRKSPKSTTKHGGGKPQIMQDETTAKYKCPICPRLFKYSYNRARHLRDCVKNSVCGGKDKVSGKYRCPLCNAKFTLPGNRFRHIKAFCLRECVNRLAKETISSNFKLKQTKETEQKTQSKKNEQKTQSMKNEQKKHQNEIEQKKTASPASTAPKFVPRYKCNLCPAVFGHSSGKYRHMKKHELFKITGKMFKYRRSVFSTLSNPAILSKTEDSKKADNSKDADDSKDNPEPTEANDSLALSCKFCGRSFNTPQLLKKHVRNHRGEKPYRCLECGKRFKKRAYLIGHKSIHQRRIQCTVCRKILPSIGELIQHRSTHLKRGMLRCPDCPQQFQYPAHLLRHVESHKKKENKTKSQDTNQPEERPSLQPQQSLESVKEQSGPKQLQCSICKEIFNDAHVLRKHCLTHISGSSSHRCPFCKRDFNNRRYLLRHMIIHTGDKPFSCTNCGRQFYRDVHLKLHNEKCLPAQSEQPVTTVSDNKTKYPHQCSYCPRAFCKKIRLEKHHQAHKADSLIVCARCGQCFGLTKLNHHQKKNCKGTKALDTDLSSPNGDVCKNVPQTSKDVRTRPVKPTAPEMLKYKCPHCKKRFRFRSLLLRHIVSHTGVQPYACMHCGHSYPSQTMCLQHEAFCDGGNKEEQSKDKDAATSQSSKMPNLREAAQKPRAEGEAEFKCKFCTKTFMKSRSLRRHILTHNEVNPYRCKACDSCFSRYDHLKVHQGHCKGEKARLQVCIPKISLDYVGKGWQNKMGMGSAEKQETFVCKVCSRSFGTESKLSRHNTMFHTIKSFKCTRCGASFAHEKSMKKHRKTVKCRKLPKEPNVSSPVETNPPKENVTNSLKGERSTIMQRIQPYMNKKYKHTCSFCPRAFPNSWQLSVHIRLHTGERPYVCDHCGLRFIRKDYLKRHAGKCPKKRRISTSTLSESTVCQSQQSPSNSPPKGFSCAYCTSRFLLFSQLQEHFLNAHKLETKVPPVSTAPLQHHLSNIPNIKKEPLEDTCDNPLSDGTNLICKLDAALDSEVPSPFACPECNMSFTNKAGLTSHLRVHTTEHPFSCKTCKKGFWNKTLHRNHTRKCRRISKKSPTKTSEAPLKAEIDFVLDDSVLVFKEASESTGAGVLQTNFSSKDDLKDKSPENSEGNQVQSSSSKEKRPVQYQCSECDQSFTDGLMLISHLEDHGRQEQARKRNACLKCGQVFASPGNLTRHMKIHVGDKKYPCPDCSKIVDTLSDLEVHRTCHDPNRPFTCKLCCLRFWTRPSLCNHYREDHPDDVYTCRFCNKAYSVKKSLTRHYRKWHKKEQKNIGRTVQEKSSAEQQSSSQVSTTGESDEDENTGTEDSDSDSAPYFPCHVCGKTFPTSESLEDHQRCHLGEKPHECAECGRCFYTASQLQQHQRMHKSEFQCQACGRGFVSLFALRKHKHTHGKSRPFRCTKCDFSFTGPLQLAEHMSTHREENFPCDICNRVFGSKSSRAEHRKSHSKAGHRPPPSVSREEREKPAALSESSSVSRKELKYRCGVCSERFGDPEELSEHGCMAAKERLYSCSDCDKHFLHASHLKKHRATHHLSWSTNEYPCNQCNNSFSSPQTFLSHLKNHDDSAAEVKYTTDRTSRFMCPVCNLCFASATGLICHFPTHPNGTFECKMCEMTFPSRSELEEHECNHVTSATEFECTQCGQRFLGRDAFHQHICSHQQHTTAKAEQSSPLAKTSPPTYYQAAGEDEEIDVTGDDLYNCPICSMQFSSKSGLLEHQNKHRNEKPFKCEECGNTFAKRRYLREHERRHRLKSKAQSAEIKLRCTQCNAEFDRAEDLSLHMRLHAEKEVGQFRCDMCYKSFSHLSHLKQHQESHVGQVVYECTECDKAFAFPHLLEKHQQSHAGSSQ